MSSATSFSERNRRHQAAMMARAQKAREGIAAVAREARADTLGLQWAAEISSRWPAGEMLSSHDLARLAQQVRSSPEVHDAAVLVAARLHRLSRDYIDRVQREVYAADQEGRAKLWDAATNPRYQIVAQVTEDELALLASLPVRGYERDAFLLSAAIRCREDIVASVVRAVLAAARNPRVATRALADAVDGPFDQWIRQVGPFCQEAANVARAASAREFLLAFVPEDRRPGSRAWAGSLRQLLAASKEDA